MGFITVSLSAWQVAAMFHNPMSKDGFMPRKPSFGRHLRDARIKRGLSVVEVAEQVGVRVQSIYFWETERVRPRDANLSALCRVLKLPIRVTREMAVG
jgi:DNA-binding XRE family transcriptional regulator